MKKFKMLLISLLLLPCMVKADMGAPEMKPYEMVVTNPEGIDYYDTDESTTPAGHIDKDSKFTVEYEYNDTYSITIGEKRGVLKSIKGASLINEEIDPTTEKDSNIIKQDSSKSALVYSKDGVDIKKGPSDAYDTVAHIKKGEKIKYSYVYGSDAVSYIYVNYNGKKGWVEILNSKVLLEDNTEYIARTDVKLDCTTIPKNTIINSNYKTDMWSGSILVKYEKCEDMVKVFKTDGLLEMRKFNATSKKELDVFEYSENEGNKITTIPSDSDFIVAASFSDMETQKTHSYVLYNGEEGWIEADYDDFDIDYQSEVREEEPKEEPKKEEKEETPKNKKEEVETTGNKKDSNDFALTCVIVGASVALATLIIIIIINKKKKSKKVVNEQSEIKEETTEEKLVEESTEVKNKKFCSECGSEVHGKFCPSCGHKVDE